MHTPYDEQTALVDFLPETPRKIDMCTCCLMTRIESINALPSLAGAHLQSSCKVLTENPIFSKSIFPEKTSINLTGLSLEIRSSKELKLIWSLAVPCLCCILEDTKLWGGLKGIFCIFKKKPSLVFSQTAVSGHCKKPSHRKKIPSYENKNIYSRRFYWPTI